MTLTELLESERMDLPKLRRLSRLHRHDTEMQHLVSEMLAEKAERIALLNELLRYKEPAPAANDGRPDWLKP